MTTYHILVTKTLCYWCKYILSGMTMDIMRKNEEFRHRVSRDFFFIKVLLQYRGEGAVFQINSVILSAYSHGKKLQLYPKVRPYELQMNCKVEC